MSKERKTTWSVARSSRQADGKRAGRQTQREVIELFSGLHPSRYAVRCSFVCHLPMCQVTLVGLLRVDLPKISTRREACDLFAARNPRTIEGTHALSQS